MHLILTPLLLSLAVYVSSRTPADRLNIPICALPCATSSSFGCSANDFHCLCSNPSFIAGATNCIQSSCSGNDLQRALSAADRLCESQGITLTTGVPFSTTTINGIPTTLFIPNGAFTTGIPISTTTINGFPTTLFAPTGFWTATPTWNPWLPTTTNFFPFATSSAISLGVGNKALGIMTALAVGFWICV